MGKPRALNPPCGERVTTGYILLTVNLVALKRENADPILLVKRTEWMKCIDHFHLSIETDLSKVGNFKVHFVRIGYIPSTSYGYPHIARQQMDKHFNL